MRIVVDSNIVFSAILNTKSKIGQLIINGSRHFKFYTTELLKEEIGRHKHKLINLSGYTEAKYNETYQLLTNRLIFVDDVILTDNELKKAIVLVDGIDPDDALFVALSNSLSAKLWTGDKRLIVGLRNKGYTRIVSTDELYNIFLDKQVKRGRKQ
jgi:predicted nucleic acid-binding protein